MNPFIFFSNQHREKVRSENPDLKMTEVAKLLGQMWRDLSQEEKDEYKLSAKTEDGRKEGCSSCTQY